MRFHCVSSVVHTDSHAQSCMQSKQALPSLMFFAARNAMIDNISPVIIDNTNLALWQMKTYVEMVRSYKTQCLHISQGCVLPLTQNSLLGSTLWL